MQIQIFASFTVPHPAKTTKHPNSANLRAHSARPCPMSIASHGGAEQPELFLQDLSEKRLNVDIVVLIVILYDHYLVLFIH